MQFRWFFFLFAFCYSIQTHWSSVQQIADNIHKYFIYFMNSGERIYRQIRMEFITRINTNNSTKMYTSMFGLPKWQRSRIIDKLRYQSLFVSQSFSSSSFAELSIQKHKKHTIICWNRCVYVRLISPKNIAIFCNGVQIMEFSFSTTTFMDTIKLAHAFQAGRKWKLRNDIHKCTYFMNNKVAYVQVLINRLLCEKTNDDKDKIEHKLIFKLNVAVVGNSRERKKTFINSLWDVNFFRRNYGNSIDLSEWMKHHFGYSNRCEFLDAAYITFNHRLLTSRITCQLSAHLLLAKGILMFNRTLIHLIGIRVHHGIQFPIFIVACWIDAYQSFIHF